MLAPLLYFVLHSRLDQPVTLTLPAAFTANALVELSKQSGVPFSCTTQFRNDLLVLRLKDVTVKDAMDRIAKAIRAEWEPDGAGFRLVRTSKASSAERDEIEAMELKRAADAIQKKRDAVAKMAPFDEAEANRLVEAARKAAPSNDEGGFDRNAYERLRQLANRAPGQRLIDRILASLEPRDLNKITDGARVVYSTQPTRMQQPMPSGASRALDAFVREQALYSAAAKARPRTGANRMYFGNALEFEQPGDDIQKVLLVISAPSQPFAGTRWNVQLKIAGPKGRLLNNLSGDLSTGNEVDFEPPKPDPKEATFEFKPSPTTDRILKFARQMMGQQAGMGSGITDPAVINILSHPEKFEPLSFGCSELLLQAAEAKGKNLVAVPGDDFAASCLWALAMSDKPTWSMVLSGMRMADGKVVEDGDWVTITMANSLRARERRIDRQAFGKLMQASMAKGRMALDDLAAYALSSTQREMDIFTMLSVSLLFGQEAMSNFQDFDTLRIYGGMNAVQRESVNRGQLTAGVLTPVQKQALVRMVYQSESGFSTTFETALGVDDAPDGMYFGDLSSEPTESLPDGIPNTTPYAITMSREEVVKPEDPTSTSWSVQNCFTAESLASQMYMQDHTDKFPWMANQGKISFDRVRYGYQKTWEFNFKFTKSMSLQRSLRDAELGAPMAMRALPKAFLDAVAKAIEMQAKGMPFDRAVPALGSPIPPPR